MIGFERGRLIKSKAGHDKCKLFVIIKAQGEYVYLVDGKTRKLDTPKKKNIKHIQLINYIDDELASKLNSNRKIIDEDIKRAIKLFELQCKN